jgi:hypothetical protein
MRRPPRITLPARQSGAALLILLALFATAAIYMLVSSLNRGSVALSLARSEKDRAVMQQAKAALIAWAAAQALTAAHPGGLPCPDRNNDGNAEGSCGSTNRLGRLPYKTLGIGELRDSSGELLWYGLSSNFRNTGTVNSDRQGTITVSGLTPATNAVAVVLAPGTRLGTQDRSPGGTACNSDTQPCNNAINYLEGINGDNLDTATYVAAAENLTDTVVANLFNDQLLVITQQDLMSIVEPVIAARIERDIVRKYIYDSDPSLTDSAKQWSDDTNNRNKSRYFDAWGGFPFAAPFTDPSDSDFTGSPATYEGLLPVEPLPYTWSSGSAAEIPGGTGTAVLAFPCATANSATELRCTFSIQLAGAPRIRMSGTVNDIGRSFAQLPQLSDVGCSKLFIGPCTPSSRSLSGSLDSAGAGIVTLEANLPDSLVGILVRITFKAPPQSSPLTDPDDGIAGWFTDNRWHRDTYYAVSPGYAPAGGSSCNATSPKCLSVNNLVPPNTNPTTNTRAIIILAGRSLNGTSRTSSSVSNYLEGLNAITAQNMVTGNYSFESGLGKVTSTGAAINDRVIVVAP